MGFILFFFSLGTAIGAFITQSTFSIGFAAGSLSCAAFYCVMRRIEAQP